MFSFASFLKSDLIDLVLSTDSCDLSSDESSALRSSASPVNERLVKAFFLRQLIGFFLKCEIGRIDGVESWPIVLSVKWVIVSSILVSILVSVFFV